METTTITTREALVGAGVGSSTGNQPGVNPLDSAVRSAAQRSLHNASPLRPEMELLHLEEEHRALTDELFTVTRDIKRDQAELVHTERRWSSKIELLSSAMPRQLTDMQVGIIERATRIPFEHQSEAVVELIDQIQMQEEYESPKEKFNNKLFSLSCEERGVVGQMMAAIDGVLEEQQFHVSKITHSCKSENAIGSNQGSTPRKYIITLTVSVTKEEVSYPTQVEITFSNTPKRNGSNAKYTRCTVRTTRIDQTEVLEQRIATRKERELRDSQRRARGEMDGVKNEKKAEMTSMREEIQGQITAQKELQSRLGQIERRSEHLKQGLFNQSLQRDCADLVDRLPEIRDIHRLPADPTPTFSTVRELDTISTEIETRLSAIEARRSSTSGAVQQQANIIYRIAAAIWNFIKNAFSDYAFIAPGSNAIFHTINTELKKDREFFHRRLIELDAFRKDLGNRLLYNEALHYQTPATANLTKITAEAIKIRKILPQITEQPFHPHAEALLAKLETFTSSNALLQEAMEWAAASEEAQA